MIKKKLKTRCSDKLADHQGKRGPLEHEESRRHFGCKKKHHKSDRSGDSRWENDNDVE